ncbi:MAG: hypothetical protein ACP5FH_07195 [Terracidiphilus sp.]
MFSCPRAHSLLLAALFLFGAPGARPETLNPLPPAQLSTAQIVNQMLQRNQERAEALAQYQSLRHYQVEYRGFSLRLIARMDVEVNYDARSGKSFRIVSESGSKALCRRVLRQAVESEEAAQQEKRPTGLVPANYRFQLAGSETLDGRPAYILNVEPIVKNKFLIRGKIWVDAADFAVVKIDAEPAKNPSFWISRVRIRQSYAKTGDFWLPRQNCSQSKVRIGGMAVFIIDYGTYQITPKTISTAKAPGVSDPRKH